MKDDRLISLNAAIDAIRKLEKPAPTAQHLSAIFDCEDIIVALPSAQSEIIRCGECVYFNKEYDGEMWCGICNGLGIDENSFCSFARRR